MDAHCIPSPGSPSSPVWRLRLALPSHYPSGPCGNLLRSPLVLPEVVMRRIVLLPLFALLLSSSLNAQNSCSGMSLGRHASLNGFVPFPADNAWNQDISNS